MFNWYNTFKENWQEALSEKHFAVKYVLNGTVCVTLYMLMVQFLLWNRFRPGVVLHDPVQQYFIPRDFSALVFSLTYFCAIAFVIYIAARPRDFYYGSRAFTLIFLLRGVFIYTLPLIPPADTIPLHDPFLDFLVGQKNDILNDLFYSGHMADLCFFIFACRVNSLKYFFVFAACVVGPLLVWQHVHYTPDVLAAPFFTYVCYAVLCKEQINANTAKSRLYANEVSFAHSGN